MRKVPFLTLEKAQEIAAKVPTPFHIYDEAGIRSTARALSQAFAWNPGFREYFAVKATPNPYILQILHEEGCGCDCATYSELLLSEAAGITGREVMFSSNVTPEQDLRKAWQMGAYINLDDVTHVDFLERVCGVPDTVCCRYNPGGSFSLGNTIMDMPRDAKYGMTEDQRAGAFQCLAQKGARQFGIHAFMLAPHGHLIATVLHQKHIYKEYIGLDACAANLMRPAMYGAYHHITVLGKEHALLDHVYDITGGLCENNDKFAVDRSMPAMEIGDLVAIHDTGAHGFSMGYNYNGKLRSAEVLLHPDGSWTQIRRAETPADYFATLDCTPFHFEREKR